jgi:ribosomal protein L11 methyltransferase
MAWLEITLDTDSKKIESVAAQLTAQGFAELVIEDQAEFETFLDENRAYWDYIDEDLQEKLQGLSHIKLYLEDMQAKELTHLEQVAAKLGLPMQVKSMEETNWEESWKDNYPAVEVGKNLIVVPYWAAEETGGRTPIILDPGLTFGTGAHASTQMVMEFMESCVKEGFRCLDLGSGSGILSLAALRLGAKSAVGVDIDPKAEDIARENAAYNGFFAPEFTALTGNVTEDTALMEKLQQQDYDLVLVNIVADVIIGLSPILPAFLTDSSILLCSGILDVRLDDVVQALRKADLEILEIKAKEDWRSIRAKRRSV